MATVLFGIAALFMRNQVRAIRRLATAAEAFGMGRDIGPIKPEGATEVLQAATAFNRMQERVRRFLVQRTEMLAGVSHDLRTPLASIKTAVSSLRQPGAAIGPEDRAELLELIELQSDRLARLVTNLLDMTRIEAGALEPRDTLAIAVVGSRRSTPYGLRIAERLAAALARVGLTVVSGLARGIDAAAHRGPLLRAAQRRTRAAHTGTHGPDARPLFLGYQDAVAARERPG